MQCIRCGSTATRRGGSTRLGGQRWRCSRCRRRFTARSTSAFSRCRFSDGLIALAIGWYLRFRLSYADVVEWLAERGIMVDRSTVYRWVQQFLPLFAEAAHAHRVPVGGKWRVDETYCRLNGRWAYCYRAIDQDGQVVDTYFSERRNAAAAQAFFERAISQTGVEPEHVITDRARCYPPALRAILPSTEHRCSKYLNNALERDHSHLKQRLRSMRGFKHPASADIVVRGHALVQISAQWILDAYWRGRAPLAAPDRVAPASATILALVDTAPLSVRPAWGRSCLKCASIAHFAATKPSAFIANARQKSG